MWSMDAQALAALLTIFDVLRPAFTRPGFQNALVIFAGWIQTHGRHAVTEALVATDAARRRHWEAFHRFFSRGSWDPDLVGLLLLDRLVKLMAKDDPITAAIDDTLAAKKGPRVFGIGSHLDAVRSTRAFRVFCFGHVWVMLAIVVRVPFSSRPWALPVFFRLYRNKKECEAKEEPYRKKTELAREMLDVLIRWADEREVHVTMDSAYCNNSVLRNLPSTVVVFGAMRPDAVLTAEPVHRPGAKGRRRLRGAPLPKPQALARDADRRWQTCSARLYGKDQTVRYKAIRAQWYRACGTQLLRVIVVRVDRGAIPFRVFFCTNPDLAVPRILEGYAQRWSIEVTFRDLKQLLGFADSSARKREAVERTAPFVGYIFTVVVIWFWEAAHHTPIAMPPLRPWYTHKRGLCFADVLRAAQRALAYLDVLDPARSYANLRETTQASRQAALRRRRKAA